MTEIITKQQLWKDMFGNSIEKGAELTNTYDMPWSAAPSRVNEKDKSKAVINKTAEAVSEDDIFRNFFGVGSAPPAESEKTASVMSPHVDVRGVEAPVQRMEKKAEHYACPSVERYPLDGYDQVKTASAYFDEFGGRMSPLMRREFCQNMVKRAHALGIEVSSEAERYGADTYASEAQIKIALDARRVLLKEDDIAVLDKLASVRPQIPADLFAETLSHFDFVNQLDEHYDRYVPDPYFSTFDKVAAKAQVTEDDVSSEDSIIIGNEYVTHQKLVEFSKRNAKNMEERFGPEMAKEFAKDPMGILNSLPRDQKLIVMRMANNSDSQAMGASTS
jgi:hypothetical protein